MYQSNESCLIPPIILVASFPGFPLAFNFISHAVEAWERGYNIGIMLELAYYAQNIASIKWQSLAMELCVDGLVPSTKPLPEPRAVQSMWSATILNLIAVDRRTASVIAAQSVRELRFYTGTRQVSVSLLLE